MLHYYILCNEEHEVPLDVAFQNQLLRLNGLHFAKVPFIGSDLPQRLFIDNFFLTSLVSQKPCDIYFSSIFTAFLNTSGRNLHRFPSRLLSIFNLFVFELTPSSLEPSYLKMNCNTGKCIFYLYLISCGQSVTLLPE